MWNILLTEVVMALNAIASVLGVAGTLAFVMIVLFALLGLLYMVLLFGERAAEMLLPFIREIFRTLGSELKKSQHPAIRIELILQSLFGLICVLCLLALIVHALIPFVREGSERAFLFGFVTSLIVSIALARVSVKVSLSLPE